MALAPGVANPQEYVGDTVAREQTSLWADAWRRLRRNRLALVATVFIGFVLLVAIISVFWTPYPIYRESVAPTYEGLSSQHLLGADQAGRDILSRLAVGAQISLEVGVGTQILVVAFGILVGLTAAILFEAFLSFLGLGVQPPAPSWGSMAADGFQALRLAPHIVLAPALALSLTLMAFNFLGDGLRDALDPRQKR